MRAALRYMHVYARALPMYSSSSSRCTLLPGSTLHKDLLTMPSKWRCEQRLLQSTEGVNIIGHGEVAATEHDAPDIRFLYVESEPHPTAQDDSLRNCRHDSIPQDLFHVPRQPRTAPGDADNLGIDVIKVRSPPSTPALTDAQRYQLVRNLLQCKSIKAADFAKLK